MEVILFALIIAGVWYVCAHNVNQTSHYVPPPNVSQIVRQHPVLQYQRDASYGTHPANWGDPIRPLSIGASPSTSNFAPSNAGNVFSNHAHAYNNQGGPHVGYPMGVTVPEDAIKIPPGGVIAPISYPLPAITSLPFPISYPYPQVTSIPFPAMRRGWIKLGLLTSHKGNIMLTLYGMPINPSQSLFQYQIEDKNGFVIPLSQTDELEDGDVIPHVVGYDGFGPWKITMYSKYRWVYM